MALASCSSEGAHTALSPALVPFVLQKGGGAQWVQFGPNTPGFNFGPIVTGVDHNLWFLEENSDSLVRISMSGAVKVFPIGVSGVAMAVGSDGKFYVLSESTHVTQVTTKGALKTFTIPSSDTTQLGSDGIGPDGNVWFVEGSHIAKITPVGVITEFAYPDSSSVNCCGGVTTGSDGNVWFAHSGLNYIGKVNPTTGHITPFAVQAGCAPAAVVEAKDGNVWFACLQLSGMIGRVKPNGTVNMFTGGGAFNSNETEQFGARGPDGEPWFASGSSDVVFRVNTATQTITSFNPPLVSGERPDALSAGPDGNVWVDTVGGHVDVLVFNPMTVTPKSLTFTSTGLTKNVTVAENGVSAWTATSSNTAIATVAQGGMANVFKVTSVGVGTCKVTIADGAGNSVAVKVTVQ
ncbi:MAG TPA: hypothetical protein VFO25_13675 [Candidatus Eremiobacteraceae bacterium]|nr:hypothetical protein [Candidatus Eremiobacteraceae bacterium]